jgi:hypothetical protein
MGSGGDVHPVRRAHGRDPVSGDHHRAVFDDPVLRPVGRRIDGGRDDPPPDEGHDSRGDVRRGPEADALSLALGLRRLLRPALHEGEGLGQVPGVVVRTLAPVQLPAVTGPVQVGPGFPGGLGDRIALRVLRDRDRASGPGEGRDVGAPALHERDPRAVGGNHPFGDVGPGEMGDLFLAVQVRAHEPDAGLGPLGEEDPGAVGVVGGGRSPVPYLPGRSGSVRRGDHDPPHLTVGRSSTGIPRHTSEHHPAAVRRPARFHVVSGPSHDVHAFASRGRSHPNPALVLVIPGDVDDTGAVGGEPGEGFDVFGGCQAARCPVGHVLHPDPTQGREGDPPSVGGGVDVSKHLHVERVSGQLHVVTDRSLHPLVHRGGEGDFRGLSRGRVYPPDLSLGPDQKLVGARDPGKIGVHPVDRPGLLHVPLETVPDGPFLTRLHVPEEEDGGGPDPAHEGEASTVGVGRGCDGTPGASRDRLLLPGPEVSPTDRVDPRVGVLVVLEEGARGDVLGVIQPLPVR